MLCKQCGLILPWDGAKEITNCTICRKPFSTTADDVFRDGKFGICQEKRDGQYRMALDVEHAIANEEILLAEGGTGIGKSYGYLVPAILSGKRIVIATAKKTLQNQLYDKDLPTLRERMPYKALPERGFETQDEEVIETLDEETDNKFNYINIKGKANYLCPTLVEAALKKMPAATKVEAMHHRLSVIKSGVQYGAKRCWIERSDFPELMMSHSDLSVENCPNQSCKFSCRPNPKKFNIIVTNHHVLAYQLRYGEFILGKIGTLIVDEAHHFEDAVRSAYTDTVGVNYFQKSLKTLRDDSDLREMLEDANTTSAESLIREIKPLQNTLTELAGHAREYMDRTSKVIDQDKLRDVAAELLKGYTATLLDTSRTIGNTIGKIAVMPHTEYSLQHIYHGVSKLHKIQSRIDSLANLVIAIKEPDPEKQFVLLYEERNNEQYIIRTPIEVGPLIQEALQKIPTKAFVSATLAVNKKFDYFKKRIGLDLTPLKSDPTTLYGVGKHLNLATTITPDPTPIQERFYESPFDYKKQARLYVPRYVYQDPIPNPSDSANRDKWLKAMSLEILRLCRFSNGDAFVLFTARTDLRDIKEMTESTFKSYGLNLLAQQDEGAETLLNRYRETPQSVLFGLKSFWEGIDVVGEKLRLVIIPKLPFPNQSDAVIKEQVKRAGKNWFNEVYVPKMIFDLRQGTGRLIRSMTDKGVIAILDPRIWTASSNPETHANNWAKLERKIANKTAYGPAGYGKMIVLSLGFENVIDNFTTAVNFLK